MSLGPFLRRELTTSVRSSRAFADRRNAILLMAGLVLVGFGVCDWKGWDRASLAGGHRFWLAMSGLVVVGMAALALGMVGPQVASAIASERDRKTLDALLASRFTSTEIVLGAMASGLFRYANAGLAAVPVAVLIIGIGGVPAAWVLLALVGLGSTVFLQAAFAVVASVGARTGARAVSLASSTFVLWVGLPALFVLIRPLVWPGAPSWLTTVFLTLAEGSPMGLVINLVGIIPRPGGPLGAVPRMVAWELIGSLALVAWAIVRLRPASRGLYDVEGQATRIKRVRAALRRPPRRPPCFDDPVLWYAIHSTLGQAAFWRRVGQAISLVGLGCLALVIWWFAKPAFDELMERGYRPSPEAFRRPELEPFARLLIGKMFTNLAVAAATGQARLEFNTILREFTVLFILGLNAMAFSNAFESVKGEQRRDTWLGLIATPLTGREILRGKALGTLWKGRERGFLLVALWAIGLLTGAVHPLGFLAAVAFLGASSAFFAAQGLSMALDASNPEKPPWIESPSLLHMPITLATFALLTAGPMILAWASLFTYEDVHAAIHAGPLPGFHATDFGGVLGARSVLALWLIGTVALAGGAAWLTRANARTFDAAIGRPTPRGSTRTSEGVSMRHDR